MRITNYLGIPEGHTAIEFVDVTTDDDTELFIDPCLIEQSQDPLNQRAAMIIADYVDQLYADMRSGRWRVTHVFDQTHEVHETRLGYGNGRNGKGKTPSGMRDCLGRLCNLANGIPSIAKIQDISVFVEDFAEDCMSDLLTNILRQLLISFTSDQMAGYGFHPEGTRKAYAWDTTTHSWQQYEEPVWRIEGHCVLLVPKRWVRKNFLFKAHQYLCLVILERLQNDPAYLGLSKKVILQNIERDSEHWEYDMVTDYTSDHPEALTEYHRRCPERYRLYGQMTDEELDQAVYFDQHHSRD